MKKKTLKGQIMVANVGSMVKWVQQTKLTEHQTQISADCNVHTLRIIFAANAPQLL